MGVANPDILIGTSAHFKGWIVNVFKEVNVMKGMGAAGCRAI